VDKAKWPFEMRGANGRRLLTYDEATPEQIAEARERGKRKLAAARAKLTPEYWARFDADTASAPPRAIR
jgi:hypothetical protein